MPIQRQKSNRLYYKKWAYRVECVIRAGWRIRPFIKKNSPKITRSDIAEYYGWFGNTMTVSELNILVDFFDIVNPILQDKTKTQFRIEGNTFNIFCNDPDLVKELEKKLKKWVTCIHEPANEIEKDFLINNKHTKILCNHYPKHKYAYKVVIKEKMKPEQRDQFNSWAEKYGEKILISKTTKEWLTLQSFWKQDPFFYVDNSATLTMVTLFLGANVRTIYEYIPRETLVNE